MKPIEIVLDVCTMIGVIAVGMSVLIGGFVAGDMVLIKRQMVREAKNKENK